jgi:hypothetical protein
MAWSVIMPLRIEARGYINYIDHRFLPDVLYGTWDILDTILH